MPKSFDNKEPTNGNKAPFQRDSFTQESSTTIIGSSNVSFKESILPLSHCVPVAVSQLHLLVNFLCILTFANDL